VTVDATAVVAGLIGFGLGAAAVTFWPTDTGGSIKKQSAAAADKLERKLIRQALDDTDGNVTHAAEQLGLSRRGLQLKMRQLKIKRK
jgi:DNA-binding NtrC family response regulator